MDWVYPETKCTKVELLIYAQKYIIWYKNFKVHNFSNFSRITSKIKGAIFLQLNINRIVPWNHVPQIFGGIEYTCTSCKCTCKCLPDKPLHWGQTVAWCVSSSVQLPWILCGRCTEISWSPAHAQPICYHCAVLERNVSMIDHKGSIKQVTFIMCSSLLLQLP